MASAAGSFFSSDCGLVARPCLRFRLGVAAHIAMAALKNGACWAQTPPPGRRVFEHAAQPGLRKPRLPENSSSELPAAGMESMTRDAEFDIELLGRFPRPCAREPGSKTSPEVLHQRMPAHLRPVGVCFPGSCNLLWHAVFWRGWSVAKMTDRQNPGSCSQTMTTAWWHSCQSQFVCPGTHMLPSSTS